MDSTERAKLADHLRSLFGALAPADVSGLGATWIARKPTIEGMRKKA